MTQSNQQSVLSPAKASVATTLLRTTLRAALQASLSRAVLLPAVSVAAVAGLGTMAALAPEPDPVPKRWQFDLDLGDLRLTTVDLGEQGVKAYFYLTYKVTNTTQEDLLFAPAFDLATDEGDLMRSGKDVPAAVTKKIIDDLGNPLIQDQISILGTLLQGPGNAKEGVVIWPAGAMKVSEIVVYAAGFSGETRALEVKDPKTGEMKKVLLRKSLMVRYKGPGELAGRGSEPFEVNEKRWILR